MKSFLSQLFIISMPLKWKYITENEIKREIQFVNVM